MTCYRLVVSLLFLLLACTSVVAQEKPNIVLVFLDNFGWGEPGFNGGGIIRGADTPRMDQLASDYRNSVEQAIPIDCWETKIRSRV